jgi:YafQ family addiction module toxin component
MFEFDLSDELVLIIRKLAKKNKSRALQITEKITEIVQNNTVSIDRYYNCKYELKEYKHCHIDKSFVLLFKVDKAKNHILFAKLGHHDDFFKK